MKETVWKEIKSLTCHKVFKLIFLLLLAEQSIMMHHNNSPHTMLYHTISKFHPPYCAGNPRERPVPRNHLDCRCYYIPWCVNSFLGLYILLLGSEQSLCSSC